MMKPYRGRFRRVLNFWLESYFYLFDGYLESQNGLRISTQFHLFKIERQKQENKDHWLWSERTYSDNSDLTYVSILHAELCNAFVLTVGSHIITYWLVAIHTSFG